ALCPRRHACRGRWRTWSRDEVEGSAAAAGRGAASAAHGAKVRNAACARRRLLRCEIGIEITGPLPLFAPLAQQLRIGRDAAVAVPLVQFLTRDGTVLLAVFSLHIPL